MMYYKSQVTGKFLMIKFIRKPSAVVLDVLKRNGYKYYSSIKAWYGERGQAQVMGAVEAWNDKCNKTAKISGQTLCYTCAKSGFGCISECCWEREFKPYPGWNAIRQDIKLYETGKKVFKTESYLVLECPGYEREKRCRNG